MPEHEAITVTPELAKQIAEMVGLRTDADRAIKLAAHIRALRDRIVAMDEIDLTSVEPPTIFRVRPE
jgi:hypothetical protein